MTEPLFSPSWYRVADLKPRLRAHARIERHEYRGRPWFVMLDPLTGQSHRFSPATYHLLGLLDGNRTVQQAWDLTNTHLGDAAPTQGEVIQLLGQLHAADVLVCHAAPDTLELFRRYEAEHGRQRRRRLMTPLAVRMPLFDPARVLDRGLPLVRPLFGSLGFTIWLVVVGAGLVLAAMHWRELTHNVVDQALAPGNLLLLIAVYPVIKALHELGHAFATRVWGGEVHEMGIMLLVLFPVPYVDASSAAVFPDKYRRMTVGAAGICVELFLSAVALLVWLNVEPGAVRSVAYAVMLITSVSTLLFNGNPLLRFDGYYVLADWAEIPNLGPRSNRYLGYVLRRYLFGIRDASNPATTPGEQRWFICYGLAALVYRLFILFVIMMFVAGKFYIAGVLLAVWAVSTQVFGPVGRVLARLTAGVRGQGLGWRAIGVGAGIAASLAAVLLIVPIPLATRAEGVCWPPEGGQVRAGSDGFVVRVLAQPGAFVLEGQPLIETEDPFLPAHVSVLAAELKALESRLTAEMTVDPVAASIVREEMVTVRANLMRARERVAELTIISPSDGRFLIADPDDLPGRYVRHGELLAHVADPATMTARVVVPQSDIHLVRTQTLGVDVRLSGWGSHSYPSTILREVPASVNRLPSAALGPGGGGAVAVDPQDPEGLTTLGRVFQLDLALPPIEGTGYLGSRVLVRFDHGNEPVGWRLYRALQRLLLSRFGV